MRKGKRRQSGKRRTVRKVERKGGKAVMGKREQKGMMKEVGGKERKKGLEV